jgi:hypothetical protein
LAGRFAGHEGIESGGLAGDGDWGGKAFKKAGAVAGLETKDEVADADADVAAPM